MAPAPFPVYERCAVCGWPTLQPGTPPVCGDCVRVYRGEQDARTLVIHPTREEIVARIDRLLAEQKKSPARQ